MVCRSACPTANTSALPFFSPPALPLTLSSSRRWPPRRECGWRPTGCTRAALRSPATRPRSIVHSGCPSSIPNSGRGSVRSSWLRRASCRSSSPTRTCAESFIATPMPPTAPRPWRRWPRPRASAVSSISASPTTPSPRTTQAVSQEEEIAQQHRDADRLNKRFGKDFRILKGIESDILADGSLDYDDDVLEGFDFVVASVHSRFKLDRKAQTLRLLRAISHPHTTIIGHMTGRQLQRRPGYEIDIEKVLRACAKHDVVVEINAHPWRLDLDWRWHQAALEFGCMLSINPDAHSIPELDHMHWGVQMARKGGVPADRVLNAMALPEITRYLRQKRRSFGRAA